MKSLQCNSALKNHSHKGCFIRVRLEVTGKNWQIAQNDNCKVGTL